MQPERSDATSLITAIAAGDQEAGKKLFRLLYDGIHSLAHTAMQKEGPGHILQTTALVNETYLRLIPDQDLQVKDRVHLFRLAGKAMRQILISEGRKRMAAKRGLGKKPLPLDSKMYGEFQVSSPEFSFEDLEALHVTLEKLEKHESHHWMATLVDMHFFAGLTFEQMAEMMGVSKGKLVRDWKFTKVWLKEEIEKPS